MTLVPGRYAMTVYPCGCSVCRMRETEGGAVLSVGVCELHLRGREVDLASLAVTIEGRAEQSGRPMIVDTVKMGEDFVDYICDRGFTPDEDEGAVDGTA